MKVSLIQICEKCGHELGETLAEPFKLWSWKNGGDLKVRLKTIPMGDEETQLLFELRITLDRSDGLCRNCGAPRDTHYDGSQCPLGNGSYSSTSQWVE